MGLVPARCANHAAPQAADGPAFTRRTRRACRQGPPHAAGPRGSAARRGAKRAAAEAPGARLECRAVGALGQVALLVGHQVPALGERQRLKVQRAPAGRRAGARFAACACAPGAHSPNVSGPGGTAPRPGAPWGPRLRSRPHSSSPFEEPPRSALSPCTQAAFLLAKEVCGYTCGMPPQLCSAVRGQAGADAALPCGRRPHRRPRPGAASAPPPGSCAPARLGARARSRASPAAPPGWPPCPAGPPSPSAARPAAAQVSKAGHTRARRAGPTPCLRRWRGAHRAGRRRARWPHAPRWPAFWRASDKLALTVEDGPPSQRGAPGRWRDTRYGVTHVRQCRRSPQHRRWQGRLTVLRAAFTGE